MPAFWFHMNKPRTKATGKVRLTIHYQGKCHEVGNVVCYVPTISRIRKSQPLFVMSGKGYIEIGDDTALISAHSREYYLAHMTIREK